MSALEITLAAELRRIRDEQHRLAVRAAHVETSLLRARQGESAGVILARLKDKGVSLEGREPRGCPTPGACVCLCSMGLPVATGLVG